MPTSSVHTCPQCGAPLAPSRFARTVACAYCGTVVTIDPSVVSVARYRAAGRAWDAADGLSEASVIGGRGFVLGDVVAVGEVSDVHAAVAARRPHERVLVKVLRDEAHAARLAREAAVIGRLRADAPGALLDRLPAPVAQGVVASGPWRGHHALVLRWEPGFTATLHDVRRAYPGGIPLPASIWLWRRVLEVLAAVHDRGLVHGAVAPEHLLVADGAHEVRLVGYGVADTASASRTPAQDVAASARCVALALGGEPTGRVPSHVPAALADLVATVAATGDDALAVHGRVGRVARPLFGPPAFHPLHLSP